MSRHDPPPLSSCVFAVCAVSAVASVPLVLGAVGFTSGGIAAGSAAAKMMSATAVANGGGVAAGSTVAVLQSVGKHYIIPGCFCQGCQCILMVTRFNMGRYNSYSGYSTVQ